MPFLCTGAVFGGSAIEAAGIVLIPEYQGRGIGSLILGELVASASEQHRFLTGYTRNPAFLKTVAAACGTADVVYPLADDFLAREAALAMENAQEIEGHIYHMGRYGEDGLYGDYDPADRFLFGSEALRERFNGLAERGNALVVAARLTGGPR